RLEAVSRIENRERQLGRRRRPEGDVQLPVHLGIRDEVEVEMVGRHLVQNGPDLLRVVLADLRNEALRGDAYIDRVALLGEEAGRGEPRLILSPVNGLLQPIEHLLPEIHRGFLQGTAGSYPSENPQLFNTCGKSGPE